MLTAEAQREVLYLLKLCRYVDERLESMHRQGRLPGAVPSGRGQEGTHVGAVLALGPEDSLFPTHRDLSAQLARGVKLERVMASLWGRVDGFTRGRDGGTHLGDWRGARTFPVVTNFPEASPPAAGAALAYRMRGEPRVAMAIGGTTSSGRWHGSLTASAVHRLPVVWVVNVTADGTVSSDAPSRAIADHATGHGIPWVLTDGSDVLEVRAAAREAVERARSGQGPTVIESVSPRWQGDDPVAASRDPVKQFTDRLLADGVVGEDGVKEIQARVEREFDEGYAFAQRSPLPDPADLPRGVFSGDGFWAREPAGVAGGA